MNSYRNIVLLTCLVLLALGANGQTYTKTRKALVNLTTECGGYWEFLPPGYNKDDKGKLYPLIIYLHGGGSTGTGSETDLDKIVNLQWYEEDIAARIYTDKFPVSFSVGGKDYSFIVLALQCTGNAELRHIEPYITPFLSDYNVDPSRVFLTGCSIGGSRTWTVGGTNLTTVQKFAAIVPIASGADNNYLYCATYPCTRNGQTSDGSDFYKVVTNLSPVTPTTPRVMAIHGSSDYNRIYGTEFINGILNMNPDNPAILKILEPADHVEGCRYSYDPSFKNFGGLNLYEWMLTQSNLLLPVTLEKFDAIGRNQLVELNWNTSSESNSSHFVIERSSNRRDFKEIGRVKSSGNSTTPKNYSFVDNMPQTGRNHYRLKMVDLDATFKYSELRTVNINGSDLEFSFGPNPVLNEASIKISGSQRVRLTLTVTDLMGRTLKTMNIVKSENQLSQKISMVDLPAGQYVLSIKGENVNYMQRLLKR